MRILNVTPSTVSLRSNGRSHDHRFLLGLSLFTHDTEFARALDESARHAAARLGAELIVVDGEKSSQHQIDQIARLLANGIDALLLSPNHSMELVPGVLMANRAGVPVITVDSIAAGGMITSHVGLNNAMAAAIAGRYIAKRIPDGEHTILELHAQRDAFHAQQRSIGFHREMRKYRRFHVVVELAGWVPEPAYEVTRRVLQERPDLRAIFAHTDDIVIGAMRALSEARGHTIARNADVIVAGIDATPAALQRIRNGQQDASLQQDPYLMGRVAVSSALAALNGRAHVRLAQQRPVLVTRENVDDLNLWANRRDTVGVSMVTLRARK